MSSALRTQAMRLLRSKGFAGQSSIGEARRQRRPAQRLGSVPAYSTKGLCWNRLRAGRPNRAAATGSRATPFSLAANDDEAPRDRAPEETLTVATLAPGHRPDRQAWHEGQLYPWVRLVVSLLLATVGSAGMYVVVVVLPEVQAEFGTARMGASLPYTLTMIGFGAGGILMGPITDRFRIVASLVVGTICLGVGFFAAAHAPSLLAFSLAGLPIGIGCSATFAPLVADISLWFERRRGIAVAIVASGNYTAGAIWPSVVRWLVDDGGWRDAYIAVGSFSVLALLALLWLLRPAPPGLKLASAGPLGRGAAGAALAAAPEDRPLGFRPNVLQAMLCVAGIACCVAMSMPQVHIVALCTDLGYGSTRGAQMLSVMLATGIVSRLLFGWISDHIGGTRTLLLSATLQAIALALFLPNQSLDILFVVAALFGLFQGGIVPSYAMIVRENFRAEQAGTRVGLTIAATLLGMALGGWLTGAIFDLTGSYDAAFLHGIAWNVVTIAIAFALVTRDGGLGRWLAPRPAT